MSGVDPQKMSVSVIIPMYNEAKYIRGCLDSLIEQDYPDSLYEIIVVDGLSNDGSEKLVREYSKKQPKVSVMENPRRIRPAALNIGIEHAKGDVIIILGAHSSVRGDFISKNVQTLKATDAHCVGGTIETVGRSFVGKAIALAISHPFGVGNSLFRYSKKARYVDTVAYGAYRREVFEKIGRFDEKLDTNEDYEFNYRLRKAGGKIFLNPKINPRYYSRNTLPSLIKQYFKYGVEKVAVVQKHPGAFQLRYKVPPIFVLMLLITGLLGLFNQVSYYLFTAIIIIYILALLSVSFVLFLKHARSYMIALPVVFASLHFAFGVGFLYSIGRYSLRKIRGALSKVVTGDW